MNRATLDSFDALFLSVGQRLGHFSARAAADASEASERLARSGHPVPLEALIASLGLADETAVKGIARDIDASEYRCATCGSGLAGKDLLARRSVVCRLCGETGVEHSVPAARGRSKAPTARSAARPAAVSRLACVTGKAIEELKRLVIPTEPDAKPEAGDPLLGKTFGR
ncbi:MAG: hypothetical protein K8T20_09810, partial [Planctomycetes bacterium]|nr:hypothetical protein [Planctomycetota bacterium]